jgi:hypothetical protein
MELGLIDKSLEPFSIRPKEFFELSKVSDVRKSSD